MLLRFIKLDSSLRQRIKVFGTNFRMDYKEKDGSYSGERKYKEKEYAMEKREDEKQRPQSIPSFQQIFYDIPKSGIASCADYHNGVVYFSSLDSYIYAVDAETGEMVWKFKTGAATMSTPLVHRGRVYFGSNDEHFYCVDLDGRLLWKKHAGDIIASSPTAVGGRVFIANGKGILFCFSEEGDVRWKYQTGDGIVATPSTVNDMVFVGSYDKSVYAFDLDGNMKWKFTGGERTSSPVILDGGKLVFDHSRRSHEKSPFAKDPQLFCGSYDNHVYSLDIDGSMRWKRNLGTSVPGGIGGDKGVIYTGSISGKVFAIDAFDGRERWNFLTGGMITGGIQEKDDNIIFGSFDQNIYCLSASGEKRWSFLTGGPIVSMPLIAGNKVFVGSVDAFFYCIDIKDRSVSWKFQTGFEFSEKLKTFAKSFENIFTDYDRKIFKVWKPETAAARAVEVPGMTGYNIPQGFSFAGESVYKATGTYKSEPQNKPKKTPYSR